jgi:hypothetical protein
MIRVLVSIYWLLIPGLAQACSVCFSATDGNRIAYIGTTVLMSLLPLALIGGGILWIRKKENEPPSDDSPDPS